MPVKFVTILDIFSQFTDLVFMRFKSLAFPSYTEYQLKNVRYDKIRDHISPKIAIHTVENWIEKCV